MNSPAAVLRALLLLEELTSELFVAVVVVQGEGTTHELVRRSVLATQSVLVDMLEPDPCDCRFCCCCKRKPTLTTVHVDEAEESPPSLNEDFEEEARLGDVGGEYDTGEEQTDCALPSPSPLLTSSQTSNPMESFEP